MFPMAVEAAGYELGEVLARLLARRAGTPADPHRQRPHSVCDVIRALPVEARFRPPDGVR